MENTDKKLLDLLREAYRFESTPEAEEESRKNFNDYVNHFSTPLELRGEDWQRRDKNNREFIRKFTGED
ncbi:hypothetical protein N9937_02395 [bacterium]|nr:hypothetical protein [bacterium]